MTIKIFTWRNCMLPHCHLHVFPFIFYALRLMNKICQTLFSFSFCFLLSYLFRFPLFCCLTLSLSLFLSHLWLNCCWHSANPGRLLTGFTVLLHSLHYSGRQGEWHKLIATEARISVCVCVCDCFIYRININASVEWQWFLNLCPYK